VGRRVVAEVTADGGVTWREVGVAVGDVHAHVAAHALLLGLQLGLPVGIDRAVAGVMNGSGPVHRAVHVAGDNHAVGDNRQAAIAPAWGVGDGRRVGYGCVGACVGGRAGRRIGAR